MVDLFTACDQLQRGEDEIQTLNVWGPSAAKTLYQRLDVYFSTFVSVYTFDICYVRSFIGNTKHSRRHRSSSNHTIQRRTLAGSIGVFVWTLIERT